METRGILSGLPSDHVVVTFQHMSQVQNAAQDVFDQLLDNDAGSGGNQFVVVLELPESARQQLATDRMCLGMFEFSFMWEFDTGLIKVIPDACHSMTAASIMRHMNQQCQTRMGVLEAEMMIGHKKLHQISGAVKGKHSDSCLWPPSRQGGPKLATGWPSLVIETGTEESLPKLRENAYWWFHNSAGDTHIVLVVAITRRLLQARIEKWQLAPPNEPSPPRDQVLPFVQRPVDSRQLYTEQVAVVNTRLRFPLKQMLTNISACYLLSSSVRQLDLRKSVLPSIQVVCF